LVATSALVAFLLGGVVPQFAEIFASLHLSLPAVTVALIAVSQAVRHGWPIGLVVAVLGVVLVSAAARSPRLQRLRDRLLLRLPVLGEVIRHLATARFAAHCRLLHEAGIPLLEALRTGAGTHRQLRDGGTAPRGAGTRGGWVSRSTRRCRSSTRFLPSSCRR
jgi:type II secretory pathway component PulF